MVFGGERTWRVGAEKVLKDTQLAKYTPQPPPLLPPKARKAQRNRDNSNNAKIKFYSHSATTITTAAFYYDKGDKNASRSSSASGSAIRKGTYWGDSTDPDQEMTQSVLEKWSHELPTIIDLAIVDGGSDTSRTASQHVKWIEWGQPRK